MAKQKEVKMHPLEPSDKKKLQEKNGELHMVHSRIGALQLEIINKEQEVLKLAAQVELIKNETNGIGLEFVKKYGAKAINILEGTYEKLSGPELTRSLDAIAKREAEEKEAEEKAVLENAE